LLVLREVGTAPIVAALENALPDVLNTSVGDFNFKNVISKLGDVMYKFPFSLPPFYIAIIRYGLTTATYWTAPVIFCVGV
jgi:hypothetical protein